MSSVIRKLSLEAPKSLYDGWYQTAKSFGLCIKCDAAWNQEEDDFISVILNVDLDAGVLIYVYKESILYRVSLKSVALIQKNICKEEYFTIYFKSGILLPLDHKTANGREAKEFIELMERMRVEKLVFKEPARLLVSEVEKLGSLIWSSRHLILVPGRILCYRNVNESYFPLNAILLSFDVVVSSVEDKSEIVVITKRRSYQFRFKNKDERDQWGRMLETQIRQQIFSNENSSPIDLKNLIVTSMPLGPYIPSFKKKTSAAPINIPTVPIQNENKVELADSCDSTASTLSPSFEDQTIFIIEETFSPLGSARSEYQEVLSSNVTPLLLSKPASNPASNSSTPLLSSISNRSIRPVPAIFLDSTHSVNADSERVSPKIAEKKAAPPLPPRRRSTASSADIWEASQALESEIKSAESKKAPELGRPRGSTVAPSTPSKPPAPPLHAPSKSRVFVKSSFAGGKFVIPSLRLVNSEEEKPKGLFVPFAQIEEESKSQCSHETDSVVVEPPAPFVEAKEKIISSDIRVYDATFVIVPDQSKIKDKFTILKMQDGNSILGDLHLRTIGQLEILESVYVNLNYHELREKIDSEIDSIPLNYWFVSNGSLIEKSNENILSVSNQKIILCPFEYFKEIPKICKPKALDLSVHIKPVDINVSGNSNSGSIFQSPLGGLPTISKPPPPIIAPPMPTVAPPPPASKTDIQRDNSKSVVVTTNSQDIPSRQTSQSVVLPPPKLSNVSKAPISLSSTLAKINLALSHSAGKTFQKPLAPPKLFITSKNVIYTKTKPRMICVVLDKANTALCYVDAFPDTRLVDLRKLMMDSVELNLALPKSFVFLKEDAPVGVKQENALVFDISPVIFIRPVSTNPLIKKGTKDTDDDVARKMPTFAAPLPPPPPPFTDDLIKRKSSITTLASDGTRLDIYLEDLKLHISPIGYLFFQDLSVNLQTVRNRINAELDALCIPENDSFLFLTKQVPISRKQEVSIPIRGFIPSITIKYISKDAKDIISPLISSRSHDGSAVEVIVVLLNSKGLPTPLGSIDVVNPELVSLADVRLMIVNELDEVPLGFQFLWNKLPVGLRQEEKRMISNLPAGPLYIRATQPTSDIQEKIQPAVGISENGTINNPEARTILNSLKNASLRVRGNTVTSPDLEMTASVASYKLRKISTQTFVPPEECTENLE